MENEKNITPNSFTPIHHLRLQHNRTSASYQGQPSYSSIHAIFLFNSNDIWYGTNIHWNGHIYEQPNVSAITGWYTNKMWGASSNDLYAIGYNGKIAHYQNGGWQKIESGTDLNINDIWGDFNERTNELEILAAGGNIFIGTERIILEITNSNQVRQIDPTGTISYPFGSVWFKNKIKYYVGGDGLYSKYYNEDSWKRISVPTYFIYSIKGNSLNDIVVCGGLGYVGHFNGLTWKNFLGEGLEEISGNYYSAAIKGNTIVAVGNSSDGKAIAVIGKR